MKVNNNKFNKICLKSILFYNKNLIENKNLEYCLNLISFDKCSIVKSYLC